MPNMKVDTDEIGSLYGKLTQQLGTMDTLLGDMQKSVDNLNSMWQGPKHDEFLAKFEGWFSDMSKLQSSLGEYAESVREAEQIYRKCDDEVGQMV